VASLLQPLAFGSIGNLDHPRSRWLATFAVSPRCGKVQNPDRRKPISGEHLQRKRSSPHRVEDRASTPLIASQCFALPEMADWPQETP
jgi:hypothetical protein